MLPLRRFSSLMVFASLAGCAGHETLSKPPLVPAGETRASTGREIPVPEPTPDVPAAPAPTRIDPLPVESLPDEHNRFPLPGAATLPVESPAPLTELPAGAVSEPQPALPETGAEIGSPTMEPVYPPIVDPAPPVAYEPPAAPPPPPPVSAPKTFSLDAPPAVLALESDIQKSMNDGHYGDAAATLERAIRIQPRNPELWHVLARVRLKQGQPGLSVDLARKSNLLARNNAELIRSNWEIMAQALRLKGDPEGAAEAQRKAGGW